MTTANGTTTNSRTAAKASGAVGVVIPQPNVGRIIIPIRGTAPLISHRFSEKARKMMLDKQTGKAQAKREKKDPHADYLGSLYVAEDGWCGMPCTSFKCAAVAACRMVEGITMVSAKTMFFVESQGRTKAGEELVRIIGEHRLREDMVRLESGVADIRHRAEFLTWSAELTVRFNANILTQDQIVNLFALAGAWVGIGEWRPSSPNTASGTFGLFEIKATD